MACVEESFEVAVVGSEDRDVEELEDVEVASEGRDVQGLKEVEVEEDGFPEISPSASKTFGCINDPNVGCCGVGRPRGVLSRVS